MMKELSLHVLDIGENSVRGDGKNVEIIVKEDLKENILEICIKDDGRGIPPEMLKTIKNPFTTSRTFRKVGLGIPFLNDTCMMCGGKLDIESTVGVGTTVTARMQHNNIDRPPLGDMPSTLMTLFSSHPEIAFTYRYLYRGMEDEEIQEFEISTPDLNEILEGVPLNTPSVYMWVKEFLQENMEALKLPEEE
ncbi:MAG: sensor histidine kinase [Firmicutes bacterium]|nr:sensor histidine kinase [Bacillota bacterium]